MGEARQKRRAAGESRRGKERHCEKLETERVKRRKQGNGEVVEGAGETETNEGNRGEKKEQKKRSRGGGQIKGSEGSKRAGISSHRKNNGLKTEKRGRDGGSAKGEVQKRRERKRKDPEGGR